MTDPFSSLFEHEKQALLSALRRDMRAERQKAVDAEGDVIHHFSNYRSVLRLLEVLNPRLSMETVKQVENEVPALEDHVDRFLLAPGSRRIVAPLVHKRARG